jgi:hypothetical protein
MITYTTKNGTLAIYFEPENSTKHFLTLSSLHVDYADFYLDIENSVVCFSLRNKKPGVRQRAEADEILKMFSDDIKYNPQTISGIGELKNQKIF